MAVDSLTSLTSFLKKRLREPLPEEESRLKMAPYNRETRDVALRANPHPKPSAVLLLLYPFEGEPHTMLTLRHDYNGTHSGQVSLPGGRKEPQDPDLQFTALRETEEEVGVAHHQVEILGQLSAVYIPPSGFLVTPYVGVAQQAPAFIPDPREVKELIPAPIELLLQEHIVKTRTIPLGDSGVRIKAPYFDIHGHVVWGATAMILSEFKTLLQHA